MIQTIIINENMLIIKDKIRNPISTFFKTKPMYIKIKAINKLPIIEIKNIFFCLFTIIGYWEIVALIKSKYNVESLDYHFTENGKHIRTQMYNFVLNRTAP